MIILLVDDELASLRAIIATLEANGHTVNAIDNHEDARREIYRKPIPFKIAILDKSMRLKDPQELTPDDIPTAETLERIGVTLIHMLRKVNPKLPIIFLSGFLEDRDRVELAPYSHIHIIDKGNVLTENLLHVIDSYRY
jgi:DNA-binding response OmpR family regulator